MEQRRATHALLIGVSRYPNFGPRQQLLCCVNDVEAMAALLRSSYWFRNVATVRDEEATCDGILAALEEARAGGYLDEPEPTAASEQCPIDRRLVGDEADVGYGDECFLLLEGAPGPSPSAERDRHDIGCADDLAVPHHGDHRDAARFRARCGRRSRGGAAVVATARGQRQQRDAERGDAQP